MEKDKQASAGRVVTKKSLRARSPWAPSNVGRNWQICFFRHLIRFAGRHLAYQIMYLVVLWYVLVAPDIRRRTRPYLDRRFPERKNSPLKWWDSYRLICSFGHMLIDQAAVAIEGPDILKARCIGKKTIKEAASGGGAVLVVSHAGCWQVAMPSLAFLRKKVSAVMLPQGADSPIASMISKTLPFSIIDPGNGMESVLEMMQALSRGELLTIMGDRVYVAGQGTSRVNFLGDQITLPSSPYKLADTTGAPVLVLEAVRTDFNSYEVRFSRVKGQGYSEMPGIPEYDQSAQNFAALLEQFVLKHPWQFFNFFDLWAKC